MDPFVNDAPSIACPTRLKLYDVLRDSARLGQIHDHEGDHVHTDDHRATCKPLRYAPQPICS